MRGGGGRRNGLRRAGRESCLADKDDEEANDLSVCCGRDEFSFVVFFSCTENYFSNLEKSNKEVGSSSSSSSINSSGQRK